ncbi:non-hydrolyzing UDP-N-acetylglucosamine 2-epimerase [Nonomuraea sp. NPDC050328]|uniref:non-hydrolyzing UDP-N-acetylglucosamine 2-epimerase n=1 Tax=Nonomuraea sp. NPDC050328 TaxID=3364361 RepID=UPI0037958FA4
MKILSVVGARPQLVKLAPVAQALEKAGHEHLVVHTGQHYDADLSEVFFAGLSLPAPHVNLGVGSGGHGAQTGQILSAMDTVLEAERPDWVLVYGDTNSTLAGTLSAVKLHLPVAHLEAGLRSFNRRMPEEHNRVLTDHAADLLLAPTEEAMRHLAAEGLAARSVLVGDVMVDVCHQVRDALLAQPAVPALPEGLDPGEPYLLCTVHRAENTDSAERLGRIADALADLPVQVALLAHPRLLARAEQHGVKLERGAVRVGRPLPYAGMVAAVMGSAGVVTDSGGLQKEAFLLERPCTTVRTETEWPETLADGWNVLVPDPTELGRAQWAATVMRPAPTAPRAAPYGSGDAARRAVEILAQRLP